MGRHSKQGKTRKDKYYQLAKEQGYRARSAYKLIQLNKKYDFLGRSKVCIDLCAAPGGWLQVAAKTMRAGSIIVGVDLVPIKPIRNVVTLVDDILTQRCRTNLKAELKGWQADVVLHDGSPNMGASWLKDAYGQSELVLMSCKLATEFLAPGGVFVSKVFRSQDYHALLWVLNQLFRKVDATKPASSRNTSAELFVVCQGFLAPKKIDPRLLDPKHVFADASSSQRTGGMDLFRQLKAKKVRHRDGYDIDNPTLFREASVAQFIESEEPIEFLARNNRITFDDENGASKKYDMHPGTTEEIRACLNDLKVLGKRDFKLLLRWRQKMRVFRAQVAKQLRESGGTADQQEGSGGDAGEADDDDDDDDDLSGDSDKDKSDSDKSDGDSDDDTDDELAAAARRLERQAKRKKRRERRVRAKYQRRVDLGLETPNQPWLVDEDQDQSLFALAGIKSSRDLRTVTSGAGADRIGARIAELGDEDGIGGLSDDDAAELAATRRSMRRLVVPGTEGIDTDEELDADDGKERYDAIVESYLDTLFDRYQDALGKGLGQSRVRKGKKIKSRFDDPNAGISGFTTPAMYTDQRHVPDMTLDPLRPVERSALHESMLDDAIDQAEAVEAMVANEAGKDKHRRAGKKKRKRDNDNNDTGADDDDNDNDNDDDDEGNPLIVPEIDSTRSAMWFNNPVFADLDTDQLDRDALAEMVEKQRAAVEKKAREKEAAERKKRRRAEYEAGVMDAEAASDDEDTLIRKMKPQKGGASAAADNDSDAGADDFEIVREEDSDALTDDSDDSAGSDDAYGKSDSEGEFDNNKDAEILAMGTALANRKLTKNALVDQSFNRYAFGGGDVAPSWFTMDEDKHNKPQLPVTKEMIAEAKQRFLAIDARPIHKIAEAKGRKKLRVAKRLQRMSAKASAITNAPDLSERDKARAVERLQKRAMKTERKKTVTVVARKGAGGSVSLGKQKGTRVRIVDRRMKSDLRGEKKAAKKRARSGAGGGAGKAAKRARH